MTLESPHRDALGAELTQALEDKGFTQLTAVQEAVLDPALAGRDLRLTSQTGSGKTVAIGFALRALASEDCTTSQKIAKPKALVIAPTRELAIQVEAELRWLYAKLNGRVASVTGGASYRDEHRSLARGPSVVVGTPGRMLDHLRRGSIDPSAVAAVVLDEADRMLELGFREELEAILATLPEEHATHLVSATFPRMVRALADSVQDNPAHVEGTRLGQANADIDHVVYLIDARQKLDAIVNLLLRYPNEQTLIFARTRLEVAEIASALASAGFAAAALSGEMEQAARNRTLAAFKANTLSVLVATEVAARGIDVQDITRVIHAELPNRPDAYTHRAGRTGRAGRKGVSAVLVAPAGVVHATRILRSAGVAHRFETIPTPEDIRAAADERIIAQLTTAEERGDEASAEHEQRLALAQRLVQVGDPAQTIARLLAQTKYASHAQARDVRVITAPRERSGGDRGRERFGDRDRGRDRDRGFERGGGGGDRGFDRDRGRGRDREPTRAEPRFASDARPPRDAAAPRAPAREQPRGPSRQNESARAYEARGPRGAETTRGDRRPRQDTGDQGAWVPFRVSWGAQHGADARRMLAMICRRGEIRSADVGAIRIDSTSSSIDVAESVAHTFEIAAARPDPRDSRVVIRRDGGTDHAPAPRAPEGGRRPPPRASAGGHRAPPRFPKRGEKPKRPFGARR